jgi:hypothetical protein
MLEVDMKRFNTQGDSPSKWKRIIGPVDDSDSSSSSSFDESKYLLMLTFVVVQNIVVYGRNNVNSFNCVVL